MSYRIARLAHWEIAVDGEATLGAYAALEPAPDVCPCAYCRNFVAARPALYPPALLSFFEDLGLPIKESDTSHVEETVPGVHRYRGAFQVVGEILKGRDGRELVDVTAEGTKVFSGDLIELHERLCVTVTHSSATWVPPALRQFKGRLVTIEFDAETSWLLDEPDPGDGL